jgi:hypothetical protein
MGILRALIPVAAMVVMSDSVKKVDQCSERAAAEFGSESKVYWSTADEKAPEKASSFIHFSRTSQPPRFTPRRKGIFVLEGIEAAEICEDTEVDVDDERIDVVANATEEVEVAIEELVAREVVGTGNERTMAELGSSMLVVGIAAVEDTFNSVKNVGENWDESSLVLVCVLVRVLFLAGFPVGRQEPEDPVATHESPEPEGNTLPLAYPEKNIPAGMLEVVLEATIRGCGMTETVL